MAMTIGVTWAATWGLTGSDPRLLLGTMSGTMVLSQSVTVMSVAYGASKGHTDAWGLGCILWHCGVWGLCCRIGPWYPLGRGCCHGPCLGWWPSNSQDLGWCPLLLLPLGAEQMPRVWTATLDHIGVPVSCCHLGHTDLGGLCRHRGHGDIRPKILRRTYLGPCSCCSWGLWWCPWPRLSQRVIGIRPVEIRRPCWAGPTPHWSWDSWPWTLQNTALGEMAQLPSGSTALPSPSLYSGEMALSLTMGMAHGRAGPDSMGLGELALSLAREGSPSDPDWSNQLPPRPTQWVGPL